MAIDCTTSSRHNGSATITVAARLPSKREAAAVGGNKFSTIVYSGQCIFHIDITNGQFRNTPRTCRVRPRTSKVPPFL